MWGGHHGNMAGAGGRGLVLGGHTVTTAVINLHSATFSSSSSPLQLKTLCPLRTPEWVRKNPWGQDSAPPQLRPLCHVTEDTFFSLFTVKVLCLSLEAESNRRHRHLVCVCVCHSGLKRLSSHLLGTILIITICHIQQRIVGMQEEMWDDTHTRL